MALSYFLTLRSLLAGTVNYVNQGLSISAIELDLGYVLFFASLIQVGIDEGFHGVDVEDMTS